MTRLCEGPSPTRLFEFVEQGDDGVTPIVRRMTETEVLNSYWDYWCQQMRRAGQDKLISRENCLNEWCVVHWAITLD